MIKNTSDLIEPPFTDRGVGNTQGPCLKALSEFKHNTEVLFDWLQVTFQDTNVDDVIFSLFRCNRNDCVFIPSGRFGYNNSLVFSENILIMWHDIRYDMGVHLLLSGSACRILENLMDWSLFFQRILTFNNIKFTRIDIAIDIFKNYFDIPLLRKKISDGEVISKFRDSTYIEQIKIKDGTITSGSLKFGSMSSDIYIVFYDKLAERINASVIVDDSIDFWLRTEIRFKHDLATKIASLYILNDYSLGTFVQEILYNYIDFKEFDLDINKSRWATSDFWSDFLYNVSKLNIAPKSSVTTIERKRIYAEHTFSKISAMLSIIDNKFYIEMFKKGFDKITKQDLEIINSHLISEHKDTLTKKDLRDIFESRISND
ncbi:MAG: replication initiation factor domain-containing protein [Erysipelotrichaceae bacterium]